VAFLKVALSGLSAAFVAYIGPGLVFALRGVSREKATGLAVIRGGLSATLLTPQFWILSVCFFALFFTAGRLGNKALRVILFWMPTVLIFDAGVWPIFSGDVCMAAL
jgi:hypothetical protein